MEVKSNSTVMMSASRVLWRDVAYAVEVAHVLRTEVEVIYSCEVVVDGRSRKLRA